MTKIFLILITVIISLSLTVPVLCQEDIAARDMAMIKGQVSAIDWVGSIITVRWFNSVNAGNDETKFFITSETKFTKDGRDAIFADLNLSDKVSVEYFNSGESKMKAAKVDIRT